MYLGFFLDESGYIGRSIHHVCFLVLGKKAEVGSDDKGGREGRDGRY